MKTITLQGVVTNITHKKVTEEQAKEFALSNFGELCAHIRAELVTEMLIGRIPTYYERIDTRERAKRLTNRKKK